MDDYVVVGWETPQARAQILVTPTSNKWGPSQQPETLGDIVHNARSDFSAATFYRD